MQEGDVLTKARILAVDDEADVLGTLVELLNAYEIDTADSYETAKELLEENVYDLAILDIMGVRGYDLLKICLEKSILTIMFTAHAMSRENFEKSIRMGAHAYIPKDMMFDIETFVRNLLLTREKGIKKYGAAWFPKLETFFNLKFGSDWKETDKAFWKDFEKILF